MGIDVCVQSYGKDLVIINTSFLTKNAYITSKKSPHDWIVLNKYNSLRLCDTPIENIKIGFYKPRNFNQ